MKYFILILICMFLVSCTSTGSIKHDPTNPAYNKKKVQP